jgi:hypothetical protein
VSRCKERRSRTLRTVCLTFPIFAFHNQEMYIYIDDTELTMTRMTVGNSESENKGQSYTLCRRTGGLWGEGGKVCVKRAYRERNGIASRTRIGDGRLNLSLPESHTHTREPTSNAACRLWSRILMNMISSLTHPFFTPLGHEACQFDQGTLIKPESTRTNGRTCALPLSMFRTFPLGQLPRVLGPGDVKKRACGPQL